jgi:hypothetical protein
VARIRDHPDDVAQLGTLAFAILLLRPRLPTAGSSFCSLWRRLWRTLTAASGTLLTVSLHDQSFASVIAVGR